MHQSHTFAFNTHLTHHMERRHGRPTQSLLTCCAQTSADDQSSQSSWSRNNKRRMSAHRHPQISLHHQTPFLYHEVTQRCMHASFDLAWLGWLALRIGHAAFLQRREGRRSLPLAGREKKKEQKAGGQIPHPLRLFLFFQLLFRSLFIPRQSHHPRRRNVDSLEETSEAHSCKPESKKKLQQRFR